MPQFHLDCSNVKDLQYLNNCMKMSWSTFTLPTKAGATDLYNKTNVTYIIFSIFINSSANRKKVFSPFYSSP